MADNVLNLTHSKWTNLWGDLKNNISQYEHFLLITHFNNQAPCKKIDFSIRCLIILLVIYCYGVLLKHESIIIIKRKKKIEQEIIIY